VRIGLYDPYLDTLGGGEKVILTVLDEATRLPGAEVTLLSPARPRPADWTRLNVNVDPDAFSWVDDRRVSDKTRAFELFVVLHNLIPPRSHAPHSTAIIQFPYRRLVADRLRRDRLNPLHPLAVRRDRARLRSYERIVCYSDFVRGHLIRRLGVDDATVVYPPVTIPPAPRLDLKSPLILAVGRFFKGGNNKKQDALVRAFRLLAAPGWELHLAGGSLDDASAREYVAELRALAADLPVHLHVNASAPEIEDLYERSSIFWHASGFGEPADAPERMEHFGITTVEAMARGCVPVVIGAGGQREIVTDGEDGHLWSTLDELVDRTAELIRAPGRLRELALRARTAAERFDERRFRERVRETILDTKGD
jgi:glycosyltransferase involved in cell wall biosynthesis